MSPAAAIVDARGVSRGARGSSADDDEDEMKVPLFCSKRKRKRERRTIGAARRREVCSVYTCYAMPSSLRYSRATSDSLERGRELREPEALELPRAVCGGARGRRASGARQRSDAEREVCL